MNVAEEFWSVAGQADWPRDPAGFVFLGRAVDQIGKAIVGPDWKLSNMKARPPGVPNILKGSLRNPSSSMMSSDVRRTSDADVLLRRLRPDIARPPRPSTAMPFFNEGDRPSYLKLTDDEWVAARQAAQNDVEQTGAAVAQAKRVRNAIADAAASGGLLVYLRSNGHMVVTKKEWWNTDRLGPRFAWCQINPHDPFGIGVGGDKFCHLFVEAHSLENFIRMQTHGDFVITNSDLSSLSPYLRFAIAFALKHDIVAGKNGGTRDWLAAQIEQDWNAANDAPLTGKTIDALCQAMRFPNAEASEQGLKAVRARKRG